MTTNKTYIGEVEALEIALERGHELPAINKEELTVYATAEHKDIELL